MSTLHERIEELQTTRAIWGLEPEEQRELHRLVGGEDDVEAELAFDMTATALDLALHGVQPAAMPPDLIDRLRASAPNAARGPRPMSAPVAERPTTSTRSGSLPWLLVAASWLVTLGIWAAGSDGVVVDPATDRTTLLASAGDAVQWSWVNLAEHPDSAGATGDVVWSDSLQQGYMKFSGLQVNDPESAQYQLWIFQDGTLAELHPIDGGVFDVRGDEVVVPIDAKLALENPAAAFVITREKPGGVVVSSREHVILAARP